MLIPTYFIVIQAQTNTIGFIGCIILQENFKIVSQIIVYIQKEKNKQKVGTQRFLN